jgi:hypothetical protein
MYDEGGLIKKTPIRETGQPESTSPGGGDPPPAQRTQNLNIRKAQTISERSDHRTGG